MSTQDNTQKETFTQAEESNLSSLDLSIRSGGPFSLVKKDILTDSSISNAEFRVYSVINSYAGSRGVCFISDENLEKEYPWLTRENFWKICKNLQDKGFIYRLQIPIHRKGSRRLILTSCHYEIYVKELLSKNKIKKAATIISFFTGDDEKKLVEIFSFRRAMIKKKPSPKLSTQSLPLHKKPLKEISLHEPDLNVTSSSSNLNVTSSSINNINIINREESSVEEQSLPLFEEKLKKELKKSKLDIELGLKYYAKFKEKLTKNPIGGVIDALRKGYAQEKLERVEKLENEIKEKEEKKLENVKRIKKNCDLMNECAETYNWHEDSEYRIYAGEFHGIFENLEDRWKSVRIEYVHDDTLKKILEMAKFLKINIEGEKNE